MLPEKERTNSQFVVEIDSIEATNAILLPAQLLSASLALKSSRFSIAAANLRRKNVKNFDRMNYFSNQYALRIIQGQEFTELAANEM